MADNNDQMTFAVSHDQQAVKIEFGPPLGLVLTLQAQPASQLAMAIYKHAVAVHRAQAADPEGPNSEAPTPPDPVPPTQ